MDVPTVLQQLDEPSTVTFQSAPELAGQVQQKAKKLDEERRERGESPHTRKDPLTAVSEAQRSASMHITPWEVLHTLARATALGRHGSSRALAQHWDCLRYVTALQNNHQRRMERSADGKDPRYHRKAVQAQDLGIAFGLATAQHIMRQRHPDYRFDIVDAELALEAGWVMRGSRSISRENTKLLPNYFLVGRKPDAPSRIVAVDCRGSHGKAEVQHKQLAQSAAHTQTFVLGETGCEGVPPPSLLMATGMAAKGGIETRVLDPDGHGVLTMPGKTAPDLDGPVDEPNLVPSITYTDTEGQRDSRPGFCLPTNRREWFSRVLARTTAASLLTFAGDREAARKLLTKRQGNRLGSAHSHVSSGMRCDTGIALGGMSFVGTDHVFRLDRQRVEVFSGVLEPLYQHLAGGQLHEYETALPDALTSWRRGKTDAEQDWGGTVHLDSTGALLAIRKQNSALRPLR
ncbi:MULTISPECIES: hypothetical protein [unclassified Actinopolyspora]|uniref:hypothetical protein n=1 Tax=unclassified Actinopolyspora TaxID=2639451 RepID=UPI0013F5C4B4|nr:MULTISPECIES: hypothetical protein [unclassified Actinopolyspora]NHD16156.1 hypothetical protein [Actinopolyspora sp. BKK2]NHE74630.1 hypothetical protein [Actinopolyspora sp. BKK1]